MDRNGPNRRRPAQMKRVPAYLTRTYSSGQKLLRLDYRLWTVALVCALFGAVELVARSGSVSQIYLVPVSIMARRAVGLLSSGEFYVDSVLPTVEEILLSFCIATVVGVLLGLAIAESTKLDDALGPYVSSYYAIPTFALYPLLIVLIGHGLLSITLLGVLFSSVAILLHARDGFRTLPAGMRKYAQAEGLTKAPFFFHVHLPNAFPYILSGMRLGFVYAVVGVLACEFILATKGLGHFVAYAYETFRVTDMYAGMLVILVFSWVSIGCMSKLLRRFSWGEET